MLMTQKRSRIRERGGDRIFGLVNGCLLILIFFITLYPIIYVLSASISAPEAVNSGRMWLWPIDPSLDGYDYILKYRDLWISYANTLLYTVTGTTVALALTLPCAYALSRKDLMGRGPVMIYFMITMYISGGLIPGYLNIRSLGLLNTRTLMILNGGVSIYNMIVARTFFANTIPWELHEAARIDGASDFTTFLRIILPLSKPIVVVLMLYYGVAHWNTYFAALLYLTDRGKFPLQLILREILITSQMSAQGFDGADAEMVAAIFKLEQRANLVKYCVIVASTVPMMILYPCVQKFFAKGVMIGSVKG